MTLKIMALLNNLSTMLYSTLKIMISIVRQIDVYTHGK
jgi:hypothetical protein